MIFKKRNKNRKTEEQTINTNVEKMNMELTSGNLKLVLGKSEDVLFREIHLHCIPTTIIYIDGLISNVNTSDYILKPLTQEDKFKDVKTEKEAVKFIQDGIVYFAAQKTRNNIDDVISDILNGSTALIFDGEKTAITFDNKGFEKRSITEPTGENVIKGSKDSFVETLRVNTATIRRKIKSKNLVIENIVLGTRTHTAIDIIFMDGITNREMVEEIKTRLNKIDIDGVLTTGYIEEFIVYNRNSVFPLILYTERPDKFCSNIVEGRVGLIVDGLPSAFILPCTLLQCLQAPEDYSQNYLASSVIRLMRFVLLLTTLFLPAFYISVTSFHQEMIPTELAISIQASKEGVPFPSFVEVIFILMSFEILVEAGLRLPQTIGQAVSVVGAIIVGQAAVNAKLVSPAVVIVIAITSIASFTMPNQDLSIALRGWRLIFVIFSSILGLIGLTLGALLLLYHLSTLEMLGVPYLSPFVANENGQLEDTVFRFRLPSHKYRPDSLKTTDKKRKK